MDSFEELKKLTCDLPAIPKLTDYMKEKQEGFIEYDVENGTSLSHSLLSQKEISVAKTFISSGGKFPEHNHDEREFILIFVGSIVVYTDEIRSILKTGDCMIFEPTIPHRVTALEDTWFIAMTIPYSKDFPNECK
jgi:quercetin dioxygenase-like cupin family protein